MICVICLIGFLTQRYRHGYYCSENRNSLSAKASQCLQTSHQSIGE